MASRSSDLDKSRCCRHHVMRRSRMMTPRVLRKPRPTKPWPSRLGTSRFGSATSGGAGGTDSRPHPREHTWEPPPGGSKGRDAGSARQGVAQNPRPEPALQSSDSRSTRLCVPVAGAQGAGAAQGGGRRRARHRVGRRGDVDEGGRTPRQPGEAAGAHAGVVDRGRMRPRCDWQDAWRTGRPCSHPGGHSASSGHVALAPNHTPEGPLHLNARSPDLGAPAPRPATPGPWPSHPTTLALAPLQRAPARPPTRPTWHGRIGGSLTLLFLFRPARPAAARLHPSWGRSGCAGVGPRSWRWLRAPTPAQRADRPPSLRRRGIPARPRGPWGSVSRSPHRCPSRPLPPLASCRCRRHTGAPPWRLWAVLRATPPKTLSLLAMRSEVLPGTNTTNIWLGAAPAPAPGSRLSLRSRSCPASPARCRLLRALSGLLLCRTLQQGQGRHGKRRKPPAAMGGPVARTRVRAAVPAAIQGCDAPSTKHAAARRVLSTVRPETTLQDCAGNAPFRSRCRHDSPERDAR